jgi:hypothetical protein
MDPSSLITEAAGTTLDDYGGAIGAARLPIIPARPRRDEIAAPGG